ncbi:MAG: metalloregulator ArsR/SmtB family transcription factor [Zavarzinia sp.]
MDIEIAIAAFAALAQPTRLAVLRLLVRHEPAGMAAGDIARAMAAPHNTMSSHLAILARAGLVVAERQSRSIIYRARVDATRSLAAYLLEDCCAGQPGLCVPDPCPPQPTETIMPDPVFNVLFLCTGNSARSIMAESILAHDGGGRFRAYSAGSTPRGEVHPLALKVLASYDYPTGGMRSKNWSEFAAPGAPVMDFVFTVCDNAAGETCPVWPGQPMTAHWGIEDPTVATGTDLQREAAFVAAFRYLRNRITAFTALPLASLDRMALGARLREIGRGEGATAGIA